MKIENFHNNLPPKTKQKKKEMENFTFIYLISSFCIVYCTTGCEAPARLVDSTQYQQSSNNCNYRHHKIMR